MKIEKYDHVIIGGGAAGLSLASGAAQLGVKVLLVDRDKLGGDCLHHGCVPSKALIKSAKVANYIRSADKYGLSSSDLELDWANITGRISDIKKPIQAHDHPDRFRKLGCEVVFGAAEFVNSQEIVIRANRELDGLQPEFLSGNLDEEIFVSADKFTIATGSCPAIPDIPGLRESGFITNENIFTLPHQPKRLAIIGGGVIASELAQAMARLGTEVVILEKYSEFFGRFDADISELVRGVFDTDGIEIITDVSIEKIIKKDGIKQIFIKSNKSDQLVEVDEILVATGRSPNINLGLDKAGVEFGDRGIIVDKNLRTNIKNITAIGDVNGRAMFTHAANYEAGIVLANEVLRLPIKQSVNYDRIGWTIYTDPEIASIGMDENTARKQGIFYEVAKFDLAGNDRAITESENVGVVKIILGRKQKILGCQIVSPRAGEMIREWQLAIDQNIKFSAIARSTYIYPTFGEASKWAAGQYFAPKLFSDRVRNVLRFLRKISKS